MGSDNVQDVLVVEVLSHTRYYYERNGHWPKTPADLDKPKPDPDIPHRDWFHWTYRELPDGRLEIHFLCDRPLRYPATRVLGIPARNPE